jgi:hypothetical protein
MRQDVPPTYPGSYPGSSTESPSSQSPDDIEYAEYHDVAQQGHGPGPNQQPGGQPVPTGNVNGQQVEMMKTFATDIGKVMGDMLNKIESLNNTVFTLQSEMNDMKRPGPKQSSSIHTEMPPRVPPQAYPPGMTEVPKTGIPSSIPPSIITRESISAKTPSLETFEDQVIDTPIEELDIERPGDFFEEDVIDISNFRQELEEEAKLSTTNSNVLSQKIQQQTSPPGIQPIQATQPIPPIPAAQHVPPMVVQPLPPTTQITKPVQVHQPLVTQQPMILPAQQAQLVQPIIQQTEKENKDDKSNVDISKNENIVDVPKTESGKLDIIPIIHDSKTEEKIDNNFVTSTNEQLKLSKKVGIHKKATYRNIKPSFKKSDGEENKEGNNI